MFSDELKEHWQDFLGWKLKVITFPYRSGREGDWTDDEMERLFKHSISSLEAVDFQPKFPCNNT
jgi:hypothetical protein